VESMSMAQSHWMYGKNREWAKKDYGVAKAALQISTLAIIREDLRDLMSARQRRVDNLMLVNMLTFTFAFGFFLRGAFPDKKYPPESLLLDLYIVNLALGLTFPFMSTFFAMETKRKLEHFGAYVLLQEHKRRLQLESWYEYFDIFDVYWRNSIQLNFDLALNFFWLGTLCELLQCVFLSCINFVDWYPPEVTVVFVFVMITSLTPAFVITAIRLCYWVAGLNRATARRPRKFRAPILSQTLSISDSTRPREDWNEVLVQG